MHRPSMPCYYALTNYLIIDHLYICQLLPFVCTPLFVLPLSLTTFRTAGWFKRPYFPPFRIQSCTVFIFCVEKKHIYAELCDALPLIE